MPVAVTKAHPPPQVGGRLLRERPRGALPLCRLAHLGVAGGKWSTVQVDPGETANVIEHERFDVEVDDAVHVAEQLGEQQAGNGRALVGPELGADGRSCPRGSRHSAGTSSAPTETPPRATPCMRPGDRDRAPRGEAPRTRWPPSTRAALMPGTKVWSTPMTMSVTPSRSTMSCGPNRRLPARWSRRPRPRRRSSAGPRPEPRSGPWLRRRVSRVRSRQQAVDLALVRPPSAPFRRVPGEQVVDPAAAAPSAWRRRGAGRSGPRGARRRGGSA